MTGTSETGILEKPVLENNAGKQYWKTNTGNADRINADTGKKEFDGNCHPADNDNCAIAWGNILS